MLWRMSGERQTIHRKKELVDFGGHRHGPMDMEVVQECLARPGSEWNNALLVLFANDPDLASLKIMVREKGCCDVTYPGLRDQ